MSIAQTKDTAVLFETVFNPTRFYLAQRGHPTWARNYA
jgi:hypothetical protein